MESIAVDLELHKAIEACRVSFEESQTDIVRRQFGLATGKVGVSTPQPTPPSRMRHSRRGGEYAFEILNEKRICYSLKEVLKSAILVLEEERAGTIERLAQFRTPRGRRIVARKAVEIYPGKPELVENCAEPLCAGWWYDTNISKPQLRSYVRSILSWCDFPDSTFKFEF